MTAETHRPGVFFDLGWTLEDETEAQIDRAQKAATAVAAFGAETSATRILRLQEEGAARFAPSVFRYALSRLGLDEGSVESVFAASPWNRTRLSLYPESLLVLQRLSRHYVLGLIANQSRPCRKRLEQYGIVDCFDVILDSAELGISKPDPAIFRLAQQEAGCSSDQTWMIGDRLDNDVRPAKAAGWRAIRVLNGYNAKQAPRDGKEVPDYTVSNISEVLRLLPLPG